MEKKKIKPPINRSLKDCESGPTIDDATWRWFVSRDKKHDDASEPNIIDDRVDVNHDVILLQTYWQ